MIGTFLTVRIFFFRLLDHILICRIDISVCVWELEERLWLSVRVSALTPARPRLWLRLFSGREKVPAVLIKPAVKVGRNLSVLLTFRFGSSVSKKGNAALSRLLLHSHIKKNCLCFFYCTVAAVSTPHSQLKCFSAASWLLLLTSATHYNPNLFTLSVNGVGSGLERSYFEFGNSIYSFSPCCSS